MTSWWATRPRARTECTGIPSIDAPRAPGTSWVVASGAAGRPARACAMSRAVCVAVPEGASTLSGWCSSMISADSK